MARAHILPLKENVMTLKSWDDRLTTEETNAVCKELALWCVAQTSSSTERERLVNCINGDRFSDLCNFGLDVSRFSANDAYFLSQALAFYSKRSDLDLGIDKEEVAYVKFQDAERACSETNEVFRKAACGGFNFPSHVCGKLFTAQRKIASCLGDFPSLEELKLRFGPGASTYVKKQEASARFKLSSRFSCSEDLIPILPDLLGEMPAWIPFEGSENALVDVDVVYGRLCFVPKNAKTDRAIVVEPLLNQMYQLGLGDHIAYRLRKFGVDIRDQSRNQNYARIGSISGALATLDLSSASDTLAYELVKSLVPFDWFEGLRRGRTATILYKDTLIRQEKFSSMGNGFTFPLETLIFWGLASSCVKEPDQHLVSVYGDDIIVPTYAYNDVCELLRTCGFSVNLEKSFCSGPFRESCGKDYLSGIDIRPVFLKDRLSGESAFVLHNYFMRRLELEPASIIRRHLSGTMVLYGPDGFGDGHLIGYPQETERALIAHKRNEGWAGYTFETYSWKGRKCYKPRPGDYVYPSYSIYVRDKNPQLMESRHLLALARGLGRNYTCSVDSIRDFEPSLTTAVYKKTKKGFLLGTALPGVQGYKRIKIYTLTL